MLQQYTSNEAVNCMLRDAVQEYMEHGDSDLYHRMQANLADAVRPMLRLDPDYTGHTKHDE